MAEVDVTRIAGNIGAMNALNSLGNINKQLSIHQTRLATGKRINTAADDPAGLTIATKMLSRSEGLKVALNNIGDAKNLLAVAESGLGRINDILVQMRNKAEAGASDTMGTEERTAIKTQLSAFAAQVDDIVAQTKWNSTNLLNGSAPATLRFQTGADSDDATVMNRIATVDAETLGIADVIATSDVDAAGLDTADDNLTAATGNNARFFGINELNSGTYTFNIHIGTATQTTTAVADSYIQLLDSSGNAITVDADGADGGATDNKVSIAYDSVAQTVDFGNGLQVSLAAGLTAGDLPSSANGSVQYQKAGDYEISATTAQDFADYMETVTTAMNTVNAEMSKVGALTGRLSFKEDQVSASQINIEAAYNRIMNANMAEEILQQTATAMLAQANAAPQFLLSLFR
ncbi:MAG: hypothetical protein CVU39_09410 [Chloroflexi bacterium HGW-Chloroflexi-10]|nr:MAG: hypothetical protein CVU39_09410 [Chloroflexi bacterium HGW-Chloroflexi-10]